MPTQKNLTRTESNPVLRNSRSRQREERCQGWRSIHCTLRTKVLWVSRFRSYETRVPYVSQDQWEEQDTLSDTEPEDDSDNEDDGILNAFTTIVNPTEGIVEDVYEEEELVESKFEKMDEQDDIYTAYAKLYKVSKKHKKLYRLATKKLSDVELEQEEISTKFNKANQTIGALRFENNFLVEKTKKLKAELFQVRVQLERTSSASLMKCSIFRNLLPIKPI